jgi:hypothetical protein
MTKKKVTAPLTYNPGKGRPKEHLAYLNYQEMQALKRLNGDNQERGPRGLPSFPPADSRSGSYNSGYGSGGSKPSGGSKGPGGGMMGGSGSGGSSRTSPSSGGGSRPSGGMMGGTGSGGSSRTSPSSGGGSRPSGGMRSGPGSTGGYKTPSGGSGSGSRPSGGMRSGPGGTGGYKTPGAGGSNADISAINAANKTNTVSAQKAPAFKADTGRTVNVGPMGTPVNVKAPPGGKIKGAIQGVKAPQATQTVSRGVSVPTATMTTQQMRNLYSQYQQPPSPPPTEKQIAQKLREAYPDRWGKYSVDEVSETVKTLAGALPGEADINRYSAGSMRNLAQVGINQVNRNITPKGMLKAIDTTGLDTKRGTQSLAMPGPSSMGMTTNWADQNLARQSYETALRSIESAVENKGVASQARNATNFVAAGTPMVRGVKSVGAPVDGTQFGVDPAGRSAVAKRNQIADMKRDYSQYRTPGADVRIVPASASFESESQNMQRPPTVGRSAVVPTDAGIIGGFTGKKQIYDRILPENADRYPDYGPPRPPRAPGGWNPATSNIKPFGPSVLSVEDPENLRYKKATQEMGRLPGGYRNETSVSPSQEPAAPSQDITITEEAELAQEKARKRAGQAKKGTQTVLNFVAPGLGTVVGGGLKALDARTQKLVDDYQSAGMAERKVMEEKYPNLIARAEEMGINSYYGMDKYNSWAEKSGLRAPPSREGGGENSGIASLGTRPTGDSTTTPRPDTPSTTPGRRPDIHYMWDLGINIPSPSDPNYNQYQTYLAERLAAQRAMGYV